MLSQANIKIHGCQFTLQHPGMRAHLQMNDSSMIKNENDVIIVSQEKLLEYILEHVVVQPKITIEWFDDREDGFELMEELVDEATRFLSCKPLKYIVLQKSSKENG